MNYLLTSRIPVTKLTINKHVTSMFSNLKAVAGEIPQRGDPKARSDKKNIKKYHYLVKL